jgi:3-deoxy-D-manno-octulosonate 8-phosphate phosphatase (KDO 8-P phosphatase)
MSNYKSRLKNITTFVFDYDGVLTDGTVILQDEGEALRTANVKDGYAMQLAVKLGYKVAVITGGYSPSMRKRFEALKIKDFFMGVAHKLDVLQDYLDKNNISPDQVIYMGDDIPDYQAMKKVGIACCPADASPEIKEISHYISNIPGGRGCVRDIIEQTLKIQEKWMTEDGFRW